MRNICLAYSLEIPIIVDGHQVGLMPDVGVDLTLDPDTFDLLEVRISDERGSGEAVITARSAEPMARGVWQAATYAVATDIGITLDAEWAAAEMRADRKEAV
jgi:hypothetical protein